MPVRLTLLAFLLPLLAACDSGAPVSDDEAARAASGEVLEGSISDDMLPLETLRSQPPVADPVPGETVAAPAGEGGAAPAGEAGAGGEPSGEAVPAGEPAGQPSEGE